MLVEDFIISSAAIIYNTTDRSDIINKILLSVETSLGTLILHFIATFRSTSSVSRQTKNVKRL